MKLEILIVPAIIAKTQREIDAMLKRVEGKTRRVQLDVMDGEFVPNTSLNFNFKIPEGFEYEAHLMVKQPLRWVDEHAYKVDIVTMHVEVLKDVESAIDHARKKDVKVNLAMIPGTKIDAITPYLKKLDGVLVMTVEPGSYCVKKEFHPEPLQKIAELRKIEPAIPVEVDGCMNPENARLARNYGANIFTSGSYIFKNENVDVAIKELEDAVL